SLPCCLARRSTVSWGRWCLCPRPCSSPSYWMSTQSSAINRKESRTHHVHASPAALRSTDSAPECSAVVPDVQPSACPRAKGVGPRNAAADRQLHPSRSRDSPRLPCGHRVSRKISRRAKAERPLRRGLARPLPVAGDRGREKADSLARTTALKIQFHLQSHGARRNPQGDRR